MLYICLLGVDGRESFDFWSKGGLLKDGEMDEEDWIVDVIMYMNLVGDMS